jgi:GAF domain-containing protein
MEPRPDIAAALAAAARTINQEDSLEDTLATIAHTAQLSVPGFDYVGISTVDRKGNVQTRAATGDLVWELDKLQYGLGEGPCVDTLRESEVVIAPRIRHDQRWPNFVPQAVRLGLKSQLAVKLYLDKGHPGRSESVLHHRRGHRPRRRTPGPPVRGPRSDCPRPRPPA